MTFPTIHIRKRFFAAIMFAALGLFLFACHHENAPEVMEEEPPPMAPQPTLMDTVIGTHTGTAHYVKWNVQTGEIFVDSTYDISIEIKRSSPQYVVAIGYGAPPYAFSMPENSTETAFHSGQTPVGSHGWSLDIWINLVDRTIKTKSLNIGNPPGPIHSMLEATYTL
jgi:hypothetical protein